MIHSVLSKKLAVAALAVVSVALSACSHYAPLPTVIAVDVPKYMGVWYEQALIPNSFQRMCVADTTATYALKNDGTVSVTNRCRKADGQFESVVGVAKVVEGSQNAKLRVSFFRPFYGDYWILSLNHEDGWVLVGEPSRKYAWVLSRSPNLNPASLEQALEKAASLGYQKEQFKTAVQTQALGLSK